MTERLDTEEDPAFPFASPLTGKIDLHVRRNAVLLHINTTKQTSGCLCFVRAIGRAGNNQYVKIAARNQEPFYSPSPPVQLLGCDRHWE